MAITMGRIRVSWTGFPGAPGVSTFYATDPLSAVGPLHTFYDAIKSLLPANVTIQVPGDGDEINDANGALVGTWTTTAPAAVVGGPGSDYAAPVGAVVNWLTNTVIGRRRVMARTFLVPCQSGVFDTDGTMVASFLTTLRTAATALSTSFGTAGFLAWHRPVNGTGGQGVPLTAVRVPDKACVLRSRRD